MNHDVGNYKKLFKPDGTMRSKKWDLNNFFKSVFYLMILHREIDWQLNNIINKTHYIETRAEVQSLF